MGKVFESERSGFTIYRTFNKDDDGNETDIKFEVYQNGHSTPLEVFTNIAMAEIFREKQIIFLELRDETCVSPQINDVDDNLLGTSNRNNKNKP